MRGQHVIAYAEDREEDRDLFRLALQRIGGNHPLVLLEDGEEVTRYLKGEGQFADRRSYPLPAVIFLDFKMPKMNGLETLCWIRSQPDFKKLISVMLSGSGQQKDIERAYEEGINSYIVKPNGFANFCDALQTIHAYWFGLNWPPVSRTDHGS